jgi:hypothetical protein
MMLSGEKYGIMNDIDVAKSAITEVLPTRQGEIESDPV